MHVNCDAVCALLNISCLTDDVGDSCNVILKEISTHGVEFLLLLQLGNSNMARQRTFQFPFFNLKEIMLIT
jgi:hypothetical protein